jgi:hypothetical protein
MSSAPLKRLALATTVWRRPELTEVVLGHYHRLAQRVADRIDLSLLAAGSEGLDSRAICERNGFAYVETANEPVTFKWNRVIGEARSRDPEGVVLVNSDDLVSPNLLQVYVERLSQGVDFFGLLETFIFDLNSEQLGIWPGYAASYMRYRVGEPAGCARCFSRRLLDATGWRLWPSVPEKNSSMDFWCTRFLKLFGFEPQASTMGELGVRAVQIKTDVNITRFDQLPLRDLCSGAEAWRVIEDCIDPDTIEALRFARRRLASRSGGVTEMPARRTEHAQREPVFRLDDLRPAELRDQLLMELDAMRRSVLTERRVAATNRRAPQSRPR